MQLDDKIDYKKALYRLSEELNIDFDTIKDQLKVIYEKYSNFFEVTDLQRLDEMLKSINNTESHINSLKIYNNISTHGKPSTLKSLKDLLQLALLSLNSKTNVEIICNCNDKLKVDYNLFIRALSCIIQNSIEYSNQENIIITVTCEHHLDNYYIHIKDNGPGIDIKLQKKLFSLFSPGINSISKIGMGLAITKKIIQRHKGKIYYNFDTKTLTIALPTKISFESSKYLGNS